MDFRHPLSVVTPTLDGNILFVLAQGEVKLTGRELGKRTGGSQEGVRRALERLVRLGVVTREKAGKAHMHSLNRRHLAAAPIETLATLRPLFIQRLRESIAAWAIPPAAAFLFGSVARGDARETSDIDLLVIRAGAIDAETPAWRRQLEDVEQSVTAMTGNDARILEYGLAEVSGPRRPKVVVAAMDEGIPIYGSLDLRYEREAKAVRKR